MKFRRINAIVHALLPYAIQPLWIFVRVRRGINRRFRRRSDARRVLLVCQNCVAADHLLPITTLLKTNPNITQFITNDHFPSQEISTAQIKKTIDVPYRNVLQALFVDWDLIIYVNHPWGFGSWFPPFVKKAYINHGLYSGKINNIFGEDGVYGKTRTWRPYRGLIFDRMFAASQTERDAALAANPDLDGRVVVVGSLLVDEMAVLSDQRNGLRESIGFEPKDCVVHIISTWGPKSLIATIGDALLEAISAAGVPYKFVLSVHPRFDKFGGSNRSRADILRQWKDAGVDVDEQNSKWRLFATAADVAIADNSSLSFYYPVLKKPVIFVPVDSDAYLRGAAFEALSNVSPRLVNPDEMLSAISEARLQCFALSQFQVAENLCDHVGRAKERHIEEVCAMLYDEKGVR